MKQILTMALGLLMAVTMQAQTYWNGTSDKTFSGSGTQTDPYLIGTPEQLAGLAERTNVDKEDFAGKYIKLTADIYLTNFNDPDTANWKEWTPIANLIQAEDTGYFAGHFDGDGHTIYNLYYNGADGWGADWDPDDPLFDPAAFIGALDMNAYNNGLFANVTGGTIENVNMQGGRMCSLYGTGFIAARTTANSSIRNCHVEGEFRCNEGSPGGIVGYNNGLVENCSANILAHGDGGAPIVHHNYETGIIRNCTASGTLWSTSASAAGLVYYNAGLIERCTTSADVHGLFGTNGNGKKSGHAAAGFCFSNDGIIRECGATGNVTLNAVVSSAHAGFCCINGSGLIESCYCTGDLIDSSTDYNGAVASFVVTNGNTSSSATVINCYSTSRYIRDDETKPSHACGFLLENIYQEASWLQEKSLVGSHPFCWCNEEALSNTNQYVGSVYGGGYPVSNAYLHSQTFVDTLNLCASFLGTSQWELRNGIPQPTGVRTRNTSVFFAGGEGTKENPYLISNKTQLKNFRWLVNNSYDFNGEYIKQTADIELNAPMSQWEYQMPEEWIPIGIAHSHPHFKVSHTEVFRGVYDGDFHEVKNMYIDNNRTEQGFFGNIGTSKMNGTSNFVSVRNLGVTDAYITANGGGILAGYADHYVVFSQCYTSGQMIAANNGYGMGALIGGDANEKWWLNCSSSARITGASGEVNGIKGSIYGGLSWYAFQNDSLINYLFTGNINNGESGAYQHGAYRENAFVDGNIANITYDGSSETTNGVRTTAYLQSKEFVNLLNYSVARWNAKHNEELQLNYWEWRENDYPELTRTLSYTPAVVTFESNGGSAVVAKSVVPGSRVEMPVRPLKDGQLFVAWYKDAALTQIFDFYKDSVQSDITLYARWRADEREDIDITPFNNKFTSTYHIQTAAQLRGFAALQNGIYDWSNGSPVQTAAPRDFTGKTIVLDNDIMLCDTTDWQYWGTIAYGLPWKSIGSMVGASGESRYTIPFNGTFDGQGHVIYGLYAEQGGMRGTEMGGLFHWTGDDAVIQNVGIEASVIDAQRHNTVGQEDDHSWYYSSTQDASYLGLLAGHAAGAKVKQCYAVGRIYTNTLGWESGFLYEASDSVVNCYARIDMYKDNPLQHDALAQDGLFVRNNSCGNKMQNCYNAGSTKTGGVSGTSYYNQDLVSNPGTDNYARSTFTMKTISNYVGWDFENVWGRNNDVNDGYPVLRVFHPNIQNSPDPIRVTGIEMAMNTGAIYVGESLQLTATAIPENATNRKINWTITASVKNVVSIDQNGLVTAKDTTLKNGPFTAVITASTDDGNFSKKCSLAVKAPTVHIDGGVLYSRHIGDTEWKKGFYSPGNSNYSLNWEYIIFAYTDPSEKHKPLTWTSSDPSVLTVEQIVEDTTYTYTSTNHTYRGAMAVVRCLKTGSSTMTATMSDGTPHAGTLKKFVVKSDMTGISLPASRTISVGETSKLIVSILPLAASDAPSSYEWSSSNESVATVSDGLVTAIAAGTATITVNAAGYTATCAVTVTDPTPVYYTIRFLNWNGTVLQSSQVLKGNTPSYTGATPTRPTDANYAYTFSGWSPTIVAATADADYTAQFTATEKPVSADCDPFVCDFTTKTSSHSAYNDSWTYDNDWTVFGGANNGAQWDYVKMGGKSATLATANPVYVVNKEAFDCDIASVKVTYPAGSFSKTGMDYNDWGVKVYSDLACTQLLYTVYGGTIDNSAKELTIMPSTGQTWSAGCAIQVFWDITNTTTTNGVVCVSKIEYVPANQTPQPNQYTIRFLNYDGTVLQSSQVAQGSMPSYTGATPTKPEDDDYTYAFNGWSPAVVAATADADYTAQFTATPKTPVGGGEECDPFICDFTKKASSHTAYGDAWTYDNDWTVYGGANNGAQWDYVKMGGKSTTLATVNPVYVVNKSAFDCEIASVKVTFPAGSFSKSGMSCNNWGVKVYSDLACNNLLYTVNGGTIAKTAQELTINAESGKPWSAGYAIQVYWDLANTSTTNGIVWVSKIEYIPAEPEPVYYTVTFEDWDGTELKKEQVAHGQAATPPANPVRENYYFMGWDKDFSYIAEDLVVTALYKLYDPTDLDETSVDTNAPRKVLINNVIYILRGDHTYTLQGQEVR